jgi:hypothetical protein
MSQLISILKTVQGNFHDEMETEIGFVILKINIKWLQVYSYSKLANILTANELGSKLKGTGEFCRRY